MRGVLRCSSVAAKKMLTFKLLGQFDIRWEDRPLVLPSRAAQTLAAWLLLHPGIAHRREYVAGLIWPESTEKNARGNLRHALWELRAYLPAGYIRADRMTIAWRTDAVYQTDLDVLAGHREDDETVERIEQAVGAYAGELLPGFYEEWVVLEREWLHTVFERKIARLLHLLLQEKRWQALLRWAEHWIALGQTPEAAYRGLMAARAGLGDVTGALSAYQRCVEALKRELDVPPSPETERLYADIRKGAHNFQVSPASPNPRTLPAHTTPFIGRSREVAALRALLVDPARRLVTILAVGGMGKSRLALAAAEGQQTHFPDGIFFIPLAEVETGAAIAPTILRALRFHLPNDSGSPRQQLLSHLADRRLLLVLDNFEHLLDGGEYLVELLQAAPGLHLLITSRERLRLHAETVFRLDGMDYPGQDEEISAQTGLAEAVELFVQCARRVRPQLDTRAQMTGIVRICQLVGGMPLALLLAAAWVDILSPSEIAQEIGQGLVLLAADLADLAERHRSIGGILEQSWERLDGAEQMGLMALSVFAGGFSREAGHAVAGAGLRTLAVLTDRALLQRGEDGRYGLHPLVRHFAAEKLAAGDQFEEVYRRHSRWFLNFVAQREGAVKGPGQTAAFAELEIDLQNIKGAWEWAAKNRELVAISPALECLGIFYNRAQYQREGHIPMAQAAAGIGAPQTGEEHLLLLQVQGWQALFLHLDGHTQPSDELMEQCIAALDHPQLAALDTRRLAAFLYLHRGGQLLGDRRRSRSAREQAQAVALYEELGDAWWLVRALRAMGNLQIFSHNYTNAKENLLRARHIAEEIGDRSGQVNVLDRLSHLAEIAGQSGEAERLINEAMTLNQNELPFCLNLHLRHAFILNSTGRFQEALGEMEGLVERYRQLHLAHSTAFAYVRNGVARIQIHLGDFAPALDLATACLQDWNGVFGWENHFFLRTLGRARLALGQWEAGYHILIQSYTLQNQDLSTAARTRRNVKDLLYAELCVGKLADAHQHLLEGINQMHKAGEYSNVIQCLPAAGLTLAQAGHLSQAAAIHRLSQQYPHIANSRWYGVVVTERLGQLVKDVLPAENFDNLDTRSDLPAIADRLLDMLG